LVAGDPLNGGPNGIANPHGDRGHTTCSASIGRHYGGIRTKRTRRRRIVRIRHVRGICGPSDQVHMGEAPIRKRRLRKRDENRTSWRAGGISGKTNRGLSGQTAALRARTAGIPADELRRAADLLTQTPAVAARVIAAFGLPNRTTGGTAPGGTIRAATAVGAGDLVAGAAGWFWGGRRSAGRLYVRGESPSYYGAPDAEQPFHKGTAGATLTNCARKRIEPPFVHESLLCCDDEHELRGQIVWNSGIVLVCESNGSRSQ
jgi:hypothetical protein